ncbi:crinkler (CRN) family protein [Thraustotheca clavata]|uniref:Crinkler (CRN) family protein n=1 Tax=Thraustotheca clavata TaxID=74557 RepID=A0A1V9YVH1_9STRA|nr:crinkler (CRN) family protein [Thraustotheca clavata]
MNVDNALRKIQNSDDAETLMTIVGVGSDKQIDRIRMQYVEDVNNLELKTNFYDKLMQVAIDLNDSSLHGIAWECHFHSLVHSNKPIEVNYFTYDNRNQNEQSDMSYEDALNADVGHINWSASSKVICHGDNELECLQFLKNWAEDTGKWDYWIPAYSMLETIDAVAKLKFGEDDERFCFLQLTRSEQHHCNSAFLIMVTKPFLDKKLTVCYMALVPDEVNMINVRLKPVVVQVPNNVKLYVAHYQVNEQI